MKFVNRSKRGAMPHRSRQLSQPLFAEPNVKSSLVSWNELKISCGRYPAASRTQVTWEAARMPRLCLNSWMRFNLLSFIAK